MHLRQQFLSTPVAISGANFLIAETGGICIVESEGNGRMCLTLPRKLISVAGIDKIIPRFQDLEVMLQVLPRSATGERMNPYNSVWTGVHPGDGPQEFHVVLLDNRRTEVLRDPGSTRDSAMHPLRRLPERMPGLSANRRPRLWLGVRRPHRRNPDAAARHDAEWPVASLRLQPLRRLL